MDTQFQLILVVDDNRMEKAELVDTAGEGTDVAHLFAGSLADNDRLDRPLHTTCLPNSDARRMVTNSAGVADSIRWITRSIWSAR